MKRISPKLDDESISPVEFKKLPVGAVFSHDDPTDTPDSLILLKIPEIATNPAKKAKKVIANAVVLSDAEEDGGQIDIVADDSLVYYLPDAAIHHGEIANFKPSAKDDEEEEGENEAENDD